MWPLDKKVWKPLVKSSVVQLLLTFRPFYKNVTIRGATSHKMVYEKQINKIEKGN